MNTTSRWFVAGWALAVVLLGGVLTSFHQPFRLPDAGVLAIAGDPTAAGWRAIHVLSGSCACSQRVMRHLLSRPRLKNAAEQVVVIDGAEPYLDGSEALMKRLAAAGFAVTHRTAQDVRPQMGLRGVPLLIVATPRGEVAYLGGYGVHEDQDAAVLQRLRAGESVSGLPVLGCAIGRQLRRSADPFHWKY